MRHEIAAARLTVSVLVLSASACIEKPSGAGTPSRAIAYPMETMGTIATLTIVTADSVRALDDARAAQKVFTRVDSLMSNWTATSEIARVNREAPSGATPVHPEVARVIAHALSVGAASDGAFDVTVEPLVRLWGFLGGDPSRPDAGEIARVLRHIGREEVHLDVARGTIAYGMPELRIDLGGIAKGYAVDAVAESLVARGVPAALVDLSGNMRAIGTPPGRESWILGVRDPRDELPYFARVTFAGGAVATSGPYEQFVAADGKRYGHILDPRTGWPAEGLTSTTVFAPTAMDADAWSTALFVLGPTEGPRHAAANGRVDAIFVVEGPAGVDTVLVERSLAERFTLVDEARQRFVVRSF